jgi:hypothetical protein
VKHFWSELFDTIVVIVPDTLNGLSNRPIIALNEVASEMRKSIEGKASMSRIALTMDIDK